MVRKPLREGHDLAGERFGRLGPARGDDGELARRVGVADPVIEAAALEGVVDLAGAVGRDDDDGGLVGLDRAEFGNRDLVVGQDLEQEGLEGLVGAVELVDQQDGRAGFVGFERLQQRAADEEAGVVDVAGEALAVVDALGFGQADLDHLARVVPFVDGGGDVEALVALEADELAAEGLRQDLGDLGLADAGLALEEQRPAHAQGQEDDGGEGTVGDIAGAGEEVGGFVDGGGEGVRHGG
jgi:hypothetical protein